MTVSSTAASVSYAGAGSAGPFQIPFRFLDASHIELLKTAAGVETTLVLGTDYSVTGVDEAAGGSATLTGALPVGETLTIRRNVPIDQLTDYVPNDPFPAETHERALDKLTMIAQELSEHVGRSIEVPAVEAGLILPGSSARADKVLSFDALGKPAATLSAALLATLIASTATPALPTQNVATTIAAMKALTPASLADGVTVFAQGYYSAGDGGGGHFRWESASGTAEDGGTVFAPAVGGVGRWKRISIEARPNVMWFGAIGDGNAHPLSERFASLGDAQAVYPHAVALTDYIDWAAIQAARNSRNSAFLPTPTGYYRTNREVNLAYNSQIIGENLISTIVRRTDGAGPVFDHAATNEYSLIQNLRIGGAGCTGITCAGGGYANYTSTLTLRDVHFERDLAVCVDTNLIYANFENIYFGYLVETGAHASHRHIISSFAGGNFTNLNSVRRCKFFYGAAAQASVTLNAGALWRFDDCDWTLCGRILSCSNLSGLILDNCYSEQCVHATSLIELVTSRTRAVIRGGSHTNGDNNSAFVRYSDDAPVLIDNVDIVTGPTGFALTRASTGGHDLVGNIASVKNIRVQGNAADPLAVAGFDTLREGVPQSWTPTASGLSNVPGTGGVTYGGEFTVVGNTVFWTITATQTGTSTLGNGAAGTAYLTLPPGLIPKRSMAAAGMEQNTNSGLGIGMSHVNGRFYPAGFAALPGNMHWTGFYYV